ncbi:MAG TPA: hypothetical protein VNH65_12905 [Candidatus Acidoferrum sp.]|nr:hypothetical protein [Candidatus Acidoferrum sp.]
MNARSHHNQLLDQFVACWRKLDGFDLRESIDDLSFNLPPDSPLRAQHHYWRPFQLATAQPMLEAIYAKLPARFPPLYEQLVLSYRWLEVDLQLYRLRANPPGPGLSGLLGRILKDEFLSGFLLKNGFIPFGKGTDMDYDPVCFDLTNRKKNREFEIVKLDHEEILCNERIRVVAKLAPSFEQLVRQTIEAAAQL